MRLKFSPSQWSMTAAKLLMPGPGQPAACWKSTLVACASRALSGKLCRLKASIVELHVKERNNFKTHHSGRRHLCKPLLGHV